MQYICKIGRQQGQLRITLPKAFVERRGLVKRNYVVINDPDDGEATIGGIELEKSKGTSRETS